MFMTVQLLSVNLSFLVFNLKQCSTEPDNASSYEIQTKFCAINLILARPRQLRPQIIRQK